MIDQSGRNGVVIKSQFDILAIGAATIGLMERIRGQKDAGLLFLIEPKWLEAKYTAEHNRLTGIGINTHIDAYKWLILRIVSPSRKRL